MPAPKNNKIMKRARRRPRRNYRNKIYKSLNVVNAKPPIAYALFQAREKYSVSAVSTVNNLSILTIGANFLADPTVTSGTWTANGTGNFVSGTTNMFAYYKHYRVMGSKISVTCKPSVIPVTEQINNLLFLSRSPNSTSYSTSTTIDELESDYGIKDAQWAGGVGYNQAKLRMSYSPRKQLGIKDPADAGTIRVSTTYGNSASTNTYYHIILGGALQAALSGHSAALVDVKVSYIVRFDEPTITNDPTVLN